MYDPDGRDENGDYWWVQPPIGGPLKRRVPLPLEEIALLASGLIGAVVVGLACRWLGISFMWLMAAIAIVIIVYWWRCWRND